MAELQLWSCVGKESPRNNLSGFQDIGHILAEAASLERSEKPSSVGNGSVHKRFGLGLVFSASKTCKAGLSASHGCCRSWCTLPTSFKIHLVLSKGCSVTES